MSVIITKVEPDKTISIGADSAITYGENTQVHEIGSKLFRVDDIVVGGSGNPDHISLFHAFLLEEECRPRESSFQAMTDLMIEFRQYIGELGLTFVGPNGEAFSQFHLVYQHKAWFLDNYFVREIQDYAAIGCGDDYALAALYLQHSIEEALDAACKLNIFCEYPLEIYRISDGITHEHVQHRKSMRVITSVYSMPATCKEN